MAHLLIIEDEVEIRTRLVRSLRDLGHVVDSASHGLRGVELALDARPDLVVLDLGLPDIEGTQVLAMLRAVLKTPVIIASARADDPSLVSALDAGADDYLVKPFTTAQLDARIRAVLRRSGDEPAVTALAVGTLRIDTRTRRTTLDGEEVELTPREFDLLAYLAEHAGDVVTKKELLVEVWKQPWGGSDKTIDVHLSWLRRKLGESADEPRYLTTVRGVGVRLAAPQD